MGAGWFNVQALPCQCQACFDNLVLIDRDSSATSFVERIKHLDQTNRPLNRGTFGDRRLEVAIHIVVVLLLNQGAASNLLNNLKQPNPAIIAMPKALQSLVYLPCPRL